MVGSILPLGDLVHFATSLKAADRLVEGLFKSLGTLGNLVMRLESLALLLAEREAFPLGP